VASAEASLRGRQKLPEADAAAARGVRTQHASEACDLSGLRTRRASALGHRCCGGRGRCGGTGQPNDRLSDDPRARRRGRPRVNRTSRRRHLFRTGGEVAPPSFFVPALQARVRAARVRGARPTIAARLPGGLARDDGLWLVRGMCPFCAPSGRAHQGTVAEPYVGAMILNSH